MYASAITALAILAVSAMTWTSWRAIRNIKLAYRAIVKSSENDELKLTLRYLPQSWSGKLRAIDETFLGRNLALFGGYASRLDAILFWLGIRSIESRITREDV